MAASTSMWHLLFALLCGLASAQVVKIQLSQTSFTLQSGMTAQVQFSLAAPIICDASLTTECSVVVRITNTNTRAVSMDTCLVKWLANEWSAVRTVTITPSSSFVDDSQFTVTLITNPANSSAVYYNNVDPADITLQTKTRRQATCVSWGDPHYTTFDGHVWHAYDYNTATQFTHVLYRSTAVGRVFEVQSRLWNPWVPYATQCGLAARENNDLVIVDMCSSGGNPRVISRITSPSSIAPKVNANGNTFEISFSSGAFIRINANSIYYNIYLTAPGIDFNRTVGICGNNNDISTDDAPVGYGAAVWSYGALWPDMQLNGRQDLYNFQPSASSNAATPTLPPHAELCPLQNLVVPPILSNPNGNDITDLIKNNGGSGSGTQTLPPFVAPTTTTLAPGVTTTPGITEAEAIALCNNTIMNSTLAKTCLPLFAQANITDFQARYVSGCALDVQSAGRDLAPLVISGAMQSLQNDCAVLASRFQQTLTNVLCPSMTGQPCSGNGVCNVNNTCECQPPFAGNDCSINSNIPPSISSVPLSTCDIRRIRDCPGANIIVTGRDFLDSPNLSCRFNASVLPGRYMGGSSVLCQFPNFVPSGFSAELYLSVSNNGVQWSNALPITYYDSNCVICSNARTCTPNSNSCIIGGVCYANNTVNPDNSCMRCNLGQSISQWTFNYANLPTVCGPKFEFQVYNTFKLVGQVPAGYILGTVKAVNSLVANDAGNTITYSANSTIPVPFPFAIRPDTTDPQIGVLYTTTAINVATVNISRFPASFMVYARDSNGYIDSAIVSLLLVTLSSAPTFPVPSYFATLAENVPVGFSVVNVSATVGSAGGPLTYDWVVADGRFTLDSNTGAITLAQPLNFWLASSYGLQVRVRDPQQGSSTVNVLINVTYVPKPPTDILLSNAVVDEKEPVNTVVANLTSVNPGVHTYTYTLSPASVPFIISGSQLLTNSVLDFELGPKSYSFNITTREENGLTFTKLVTVSVANIIEPPWNMAICPAATGCGQPLTVADDTAVGEAVAYINYTESDPVPVTCVAYPNASFVTVWELNRFVIRLRAMLDYTVAQTRTVFAECSVINGRGVRVSSSVFNTITVLPRPKAPQVVTLNMANGFDLGGIPESAPANLVLGTVSAINRDPTATNITFSIPASDPLSSIVTLSQPVCTAGTPVVCTVTVTLTGNINSVTNVPFNSNGTGLTTLTVRAVDSGSQKFVDTVMNVPVAFVNQPPLPPTWVSGSAIQEQSPINTTVGILQTNDVHPGLPQTVTVLGEGQFFTVVPLTASRRRAAQTASLWSVILTNNNFTYMQMQQVPLTVSVTNYPPTGSPLTASHSLSVAVSALPMTVSVAKSSALVYRTNSSFAVDEHTPAGTVIGALQVDNLNRNDVTYTLTLANDGNGYFAINNGNLVRTAKYLDFNTVKSVSIAVRASFTKAPNAPANAPAFVPMTTSFFTLTVLQVLSPPAIVLTIPSLQFPLEAFAIVGSELNNFQVTNAQNSALRVTVDNDPLNLLAVTYDGSRDAWIISLSQNPYGANAAAGPYGPVVINVTTATGVTVTASVPITITPLTLNGNNIFQYQGSTGGSSSSGSGIIFIVVGVVVGTIVAVLLIVALVIRRRKRAVATMTTVNEPFYQTAGEAGVSSSTLVKVDPEGECFYNGLQNPMYEWYRPDMGRQESEEFLLDQVEGAFVIRDSTATPGWHMLAVKTHNAIVHEKIKMTDEGMYELLPNSSRQQPRFRGMPDLVEHYARQQDGVRYALALDNPLYDNSQMAAKRHGHHVAGAWSYQQDGDAPSVPLKEREKAVMEQLAADGEAELYTNAAQAKSAISSA